MVCYDVSLMRKGPRFEKGRFMARKGGGGTEIDDLQTLNFKVPDAFKRSYKVHAAERGMSMLDLLKEGFELSKKMRR